MTTRRYLVGLAGLALVAAAAVALDAALGDGPVSWAAALVATTVGVALLTRQWATREGGRPDEGVRGRRSDRVI